MGSKRAQPDYTGLQSVPRHDAPEVVPESQSRSSVLRSSSVNYPEAYAPAKDEKPRYECFGGQQHDVRAHYGDASKAGGDADKEVGGPSSQKRICGIRRKLFFWILAIVILVIVIAAVLGGVLGSVLGNASSKA